MKDTSIIWEKAKAHAKAEIDAMPPTADQATQEWRLHLLNERAELWFAEYLRTSYPSLTAAEFAACLRLANKCTSSKNGVLIYLDLAVNLAFEIAHLQRIQENK